MDRFSFKQMLDTPPGRRDEGYWKSLEELAGEAEFDVVLKKEWPRLAGAFQDAVPEMDRRSFVKLVVANIAVLGVAGCDQPADEEMVGYITRPESLVAGTPAYYATALSLSGYASGVLGEAHEGRPTRIQGHPDDPVSNGASSAIQQADIYNLYDPDRLVGIRRGNEDVSWDIFLGRVNGWRDKWKKNGGAGARLLTGRVTSPSLLAEIGALRDEFPSMRWHVWEPVDRSAVEEGSRLAFGEKVDTQYHLKKARRILSLDADFLSVEEPLHLRYAREFAQARRPRPDGAPPARLYVIDSTPTLAGAKADHRLPLRHSNIEAVARILAGKLGLAVDAPSLPEGVDEKWLDALADDLKAHRGESVVMPGACQPASLHALVHAINDALGNTGETVTHHAPVAGEPDGTLADLAGEMENGGIDTLFVIGGNPVYDAPADTDFAGRLKKVEEVVYLGLHENETAAEARWVLPGTHELEAWGDIRALDGTTYLQQPLIRPIHGGRSVLELVALLRGDYQTTGRELLKRRIRQRLPALEDPVAWRGAVQRGFLPEHVDERRLSLRADWASSLPAVKQSANDIELQFRPHPAIWDGRFANNGWLQELPDMLSKLVWGNAALVSPAFARKHDLEKGSVVRIRANGRKIEAPVWPMPGQPDDAITLHLGFGRERAGELGSGVGVNANVLRDSASLWTAGAVEIEATGRSGHLVTTQHHHDIEGRDLLREADWQTYSKNPAFAKRENEQHLESLYPEASPRGDYPARYEWGMTIEQDVCIGCNACVTACQAENNIPIVGKEEVDRGREMHWLRIDRYYAGAPENPKVSLQPIPCMHCENAPCEYVCPVEATQHSAEGLNEMIYNRCIGTRYCSQNCPYKVRRFNWFDYTGPDADLPFVEAAQNPDVTVRSRGVMEKCTYCVQRINRTRIAAQREGREIRDGELVTACQEACPAGAIVFGDVSDPDTAVSKNKADPRNYGLLADLNTRPRTTYLAGVRNPNPELDRGKAKEKPS